MRRERQASDWLMSEVLRWVAPQRAGREQKRPDGVEQEEEDRNRVQRAAPNPSGSPLSHIAMQAEQEPGVEQCDVQVESAFEFERQVQDGREDDRRMPEDH